ncbi:MAG: iron-sulfur cluster carrier protein MrpORP [Fibrobacterota bacterium]
MEKTRPEQEDLNKALSGFKKKIAVLSGKGGVGKSTAAVNIAASLAAAGNSVGLLDVDLHGPSVPHMVGQGKKHAGFDGTRLLPVEAGENLKVMSLQFLLENTDDPVVWRGPMKHNAIKQLISDVVWGPLDYLIVDAPPGTGDEPLAVLQILGDVDAAVIVTTPQCVATNDVRKCVNFCRKMSVPIAGVIENMSGFKCPHCGNITDIYGRGGGETMAMEMNIDMIESVPADPGISVAGDAGKPYAFNYPESEIAEIFSSAAQKIINFCKEQGAVEMNKIAIPSNNGELSMHFGHCTEFLFFNTEDKKIISSDSDTPPEHEPGLLPKWLSETHGVNTVIAGGMGQRAKGLFESKGIKVITGAPGGKPEEIVRFFLAGSLQTGANVCDH